MGAEAAEAAAAEVVVAAAEGLKQAPLSHLTVQWHITDRCNLRCKHCYQEEYQQAGFRLPLLRSIAAQVFDWHKLESRKAGHEIPLFINLTGGEPLIHPDFFSLLAFLKSQPVKARLGLFSNGSLIGRSQAEQLAALDISFVQLSVEGGPGTHEAIRGPGSFTDTISASRILKERGIRVIWSFTAHSGNYTEFPLVSETARKCRINRLWSDRLIPFPRDGGPRPLDFEQTREYLFILGRTQKETQKKWNSKTEIYLGRALQFQANGGTPYHCRAGRELIAIMPNGDLHPCRRLPLKAGNLLDQPLTELYETDLLRRLRAFACPDECIGCLYKHDCRGGLRCLAQALSGDMFRPDPGCGAMA